MSADERVWKPSEKSLDISDSDDSESFRDAVLEGSDFRHAFVVADFSRARLRDCRFFEANVKTCTFDEADLRGCNFTGAAIDAATFRRRAWKEPTSPKHPCRAIR